MTAADVLLALLAGAVQGVFEWLPISSEGAVSILLAGLGFTPAAAVRLALFLHAGTALAATAYYRREIASLLADLPAWRPSQAFERDTATLTFLALATLISAAVGLAAYSLLLAAATALAGGAFVALIGGLLVLTGLVQRAADRVVVDQPPVPGTLDALLVGVGQGLAVLPGVSRSGTTVSLLLLRGHDGEVAFDLSFLLAIPASLGAAVLAVGDGGMLFSPTAGAIAFAVSAVVGYLAIGALLALVREIAFWGVCVGFGGLAVVGGLLVIVW